MYEVFRKTLYREVNGLHISGKQHGSHIQN